MDNTTVNKRSSSSGGEFKNISSPKSVRILMRKYSHGSFSSKATKVTEAVRKDQPRIPQERVSKDIETDPQYDRRFNVYDKVVASRMLLSQ
jgi:hypothetical protein